MYAWGDNPVGHHFIPGRELLAPQEVPLDKNPVQVLAAADYRCCVLLRDGSVHTFSDSNDRSLGHTLTGTKVHALEALNIKDVFAGGDHIFVISDKGQVYGWGLNSKGQLGWKDDNDTSIVTVPKSLKFFHSKKVVQMSCGKLHSLMLLQDGTLFSMGDNEYGQQGIGSTSPLTQPSEVMSLRGLPILQIVCGGWHSFCVTFSGKVFCWGRNDCGQLGLGDRSNRSSPNLLKMLRSQVVMYVAAGESHSVVLMKDGGVFTFGSSSRGQLGHGSLSEYEVNPRKVFELMGSVVTQVACGLMHTVAFVPDTGNIFTCGSGEYGQLGQGKKIEFLSLPTIVKGGWCEPQRAIPNNDLSGGSGLFPGASLYNIKQVGAGGNQSFVIMCSNSTEQSLDFREIVSHRRILTLNNDLCERIGQLGDASMIPVEIVSQLECILSSQNCMNASFLASDHHLTSSKYSGLNLLNAKLLFTKLCQCKNRRILSTIESCLSWKLLPSLATNPPDVEALRLYISLPVLELFHNPVLYNGLLFPFVEKLLTLSENPSKVLDQWYSKLEADNFVVPIRICQRCIIDTIKLGLPPIEVKHKVMMMLKYLSKLNKVNNAADPPILDFRKFYIPELNRLIPLDSDHQQWARSHGNDFSFCRFPFVFNSDAKTSLLQIDAKYQMQAAYQHARGQNMAAFFGLNAGMIEHPVIEIQVQRERLVEDAISSIASIGNLKRPFTVQFRGEEGQDAGGVRKEFFMLILREVLNPKYGMFRHFEDSSLLWFSDYELETDAMYLLVGTICGLAIYNSTIIDLNFPLALYKKLLNVQPTLSDLKELDPTLGNSLQQILDFREEDGMTVTDVFCLFFTAPREMFGEVSSIELVPDGENVPVTADNREQYVHSFVDYIFNWSVKRPFEHFSQGFHKVCGGEVMNLFRPEELMEMVVGNQNYDWEELEKSTEYKGVYYAKHQVIVWFWEVFHSLSLEERKEFLLFLTGCNKVPINGLKIYIQPINVEDDFLPVAHTCFNLLDLPRYTSKEKLEEKLKLALKNNQGFHLA